METNMNEKAQLYWNKFWEGKVQPTSVVAEQFGFECHADELSQLILDGKKTATCSAYVLYEIENQPLPTVDTYTIVLNSKNEPVAIIRTTEVQIIKMNEVPEALALAEGEGDLTFEYWWNGHKKHFTIELEEVGLEFSEDMLLVFERFELIDKAK
ncbi:MAG: ASCH domain-containing protein [Defluviitaleaceae bacterium]|nr:ASCH domain-containing protein [Defluviitaleaceae bacterium]